MPLVNYIVNASTSVIQIPTVLLSTTQSTPIVLLSSLNSPGQIITVRDTDGICSLDFPIVISTTSNVHYLEGPQVSTLRITQPFGFAAVSPRTSTIWNILNTYAFPEQYAAANLNTLNTSIIYTSSMIATGEIVMSSVTVSSLNVTTFVTSASTSVNAMVVKSTLNVGDTISTGGNVFIGGELSTVSTVNVGTDAYIAQNLFVASTISTTYVDVGYEVITQYIQAYGSSSGAYNTFLANIQVFGIYSFMSSCYIDFIQVCSVNAYDTVSTLAHVQMTSTLTVEGQALFQNHLSTTSNVSIGGNLSTTSNAVIGGNLSVGGFFSTASITTGQISTVNLFVGTPGFGGYAQFKGIAEFKNTLSAGTIEAYAIGATTVNFGDGRFDSSVFFGADATCESTLTVFDKSFLAGAVSTGSTLTVADGATIAKLLNASSISTTGNVVVGASLSASSFNTTNITASTFTITSNATVQSTLTANIVAVGPSTVRLNLSTATQGCAITWNQLTSITGGSAYTELIGSKGTVGGVGGFAFYTQVPNDTVPALSNLALQITDRGNNTQTLIVNGGATFSSTITTQILSATSSIIAINSGRYIKLHALTANAGMSVTWNSYPGTGGLGNGYTEILSAKGGGGIGGFAFFTAIQNDTTAVASNLAMLINSNGNQTNTINVNGGGTFTSTVVCQTLTASNATFSNGFIVNAGTTIFSNGFGVTGGLCQFSGTTTPLMTYGLTLNDVTSNASRLTVGCSSIFTNLTTFSNSANFVLGTATFSNTVNYAAGATTTFCNTVNFSNATVQGLSISFPVTNL